VGPAAAYPGIQRTERDDYARMFFTVPIFRMGGSLPLLPYTRLGLDVCGQGYRVGHEKVARFPFARVLVIFSLWHL
jgi:hypothetical protein